MDTFQPDLNRETVRNRCARSAPSGRQLSTVSVLKAVIPLSADGVEKLGLEDVVRS
jgi:hypothetical protein